MTIYDRLDNETRRKLNATKPKQQPKKKNKEKLSKRDIEELMGVNRDRYTRVNGKVRRK